MYKIISHIISEQNPKFSNHPDNKFTHILQLKNGDLCNAKTFKLFTHNDTHIDVPFHYNIKGMKLNEMDPKDFFYNNVVVADLNLKIGKEICTAEIKDLLKPQTDLLLIYTGLNEYWFDKPGEFSLKENQPWIAMELAEYLVKKTNLRAIGIDFGCVDNMENIAKNNPIVHKTLLGLNEILKVIFIFENMNIRPVLNSTIKKVFALPLLLSGMDGGPATIVAETLL